MILERPQRPPGWAEGEPKEEERGAWKPRVKAFGDYAGAIAERYSGSYPDPKRPGRTLPRVCHFQAWNEGNLHSFLAPQLENVRRFAVDHFRRLVNRTYGEIKSVHRTNKVIVGGSAPVGPTNPRRTDPIAFRRKVLCLGANRHFSYRVKLRPGQRVRARIGSERSPVWTHRR